METSESGPPTQIPLTTGKWSPKDSCPLFSILGYYFGLHLVTKKNVQRHISMSLVLLSATHSVFPFGNPIHIRVLFPVEMDQTKRVKDYATNKYQNYQIIFYLFSQTIASSSVKLNTDISITMQERKCTILWRFFLLDQNRT